MNYTHRQDGTTDMLTAKKHKKAYFTLKKQAA